MFVFHSESLLKAVEWDSGLPKWNAGFKTQLFCPDFVFVFKASPTMPNIKLLTIVILFRDSYLDISLL